MDKDLKLTFEEREDLVQFLGTDAWDAFCKVLSFIEQKHINKVLKYHLNDGPEGLLIEKARVEGVQHLIRDINEYRKRLIKEQ